jgi:hypothetical protein
MCHILLLEGRWIEDDVVDAALQQNSTQLVAEVREVLVRKPFVTFPHLI